MGRGCIFSAIPVLVFQGAVTLLARLLQPIMTATAVANLSTVGSILIFCVGVNLIWGTKFRVANLSTVGSILIFCVGVNLIWGTKFRVANMLPALIVAVAAAFVL